MCPHNLLQFKHTYLLYNKIVYIRHTKIQQIMFIILLFQKKNLLQ